MDDPLVVRCGKVIRTFRLCTMSIVTLRLGRLPDFELWSEERAFLRYNQHVWLQTNPPSTHYLRH